MCVYIYIYKYSINYLTQHSPWLSNTHVKLNMSKAKLKLFLQNLLLWPFSTDYTSYSVPYKWQSQEL